MTVPPIMTRSPPLEVPPIKIVPPEIVILSPSVKTVPSATTSGPPVESPF